MAPSPQRSTLCSRRLNCLINVRPRREPNSGLPPATPEVSVPEPGLCGRAPTCGLAAVLQLTRGGARRPAPASCPDHAFGDVTNDSSQIAGSPRLAPGGRAGPRCTLRSRPCLEVWGLRPNSFLHELPFPASSLRPLCPFECPEPRAEAAGSRRGVPEGASGHILRLWDTDEGSELRV